MALVCFERQKYEINLLALNELKLYVFFIQNSAQTCKTNWAVVKKKSCNYINQKVRVNCQRSRVP